jgi:hypothetical protein
VNEAWRMRCQLRFALIGSPLWPQRYATYIQVFNFGHQSHDFPICSYQLFLSRFVAGVNPSPINRWIIRGALTVHLLYTPIVYSFRPQLTSITSRHACNDQSSFFPSECQCPPMKTGRYMFLGWLGTPSNVHFGIPSGATLGLILRL